MWDAIHLTFGVEESKLLAPVRRYNGKWFISFFLRGTYENVIKTSTISITSKVAMINAREPLVDDVIGFMDGVSLPTECTSEELEQNAMYDGYTCDTAVNNVLAYGPDGKVFLCALNFPGSWTDGKLSAHFIEFIKGKIGRYKICVDQGFPRQGEAYGILVGPISKRSARRLHRDVRDYLLKISNVHTSLRQASEWGMRGLQGTFPHLKRRLPSDDNKRKKVLESIVYVHNL